MIDVVVEFAAKPAHYELPAFVFRYILDAHDPPEVVEGHKGEVEGAGSLGRRRGHADRPRDGIAVHDGGDLLIGIDRERGVAGLTESHLASGREVITGDDDLGSDPALIRCCAQYQRRFAYEEPTG